MPMRIGTSVSLALLLGLATARGSIAPGEAQIKGGRSDTRGLLPASSRAVGPILDSVVTFTDSSRTIDEPERIQRELLQTDRLISVIQSKIDRSGSAQAQDRFHDALERQREAREAYGDKRLARATRLTREARSLAREGAVLVGPPEEDPAYVGHSIDRAAEALSIAEDVLRGTQDPGIWKRYNLLRNDLDDARALHRDGATRLAYSRATGVRDGVLVLLQDCERLPIPEDTASRAIRNAEHAIDTAGKELGPSPGVPASRWKREAVDQLSKAHLAFAHGDYRWALIYSKLVERNLEQAVTAQRAASS